MKKIILLLVLNLSFLIFNFQKAKAQNVYIPDANFKYALVNNSAINTNGDAEIQVSEANYFTGEIWVNYSNISDLTGIETFTNIESLSCGGNQLTSLDITNNTSLVSLSCFGNQLTSLDITNNTSLSGLFCGVNYLTSLNVSSNLALNNLDCSENQLTSLNVSANTALIDLKCQNNLLTNLNVSTNTALYVLNCGTNYLTSLNISFNLALYALECTGNQLTSLDISANTALEQLQCNGNQLSSLDISANTALNGLDCRDNQLTSLDITNNTSLSGLYCGINQLTSLNVSFNLALHNLDCSYNQLTNLNVLANTALITLKCHYNQLTSLNVSANTALNYLECNNNQLTSLNVSANTALNYLECNSNQLTSLDLSANNALSTLFCYSNQLTTISQVPNSMTYFRIHNNNISCFYNLPQVSSASYGSIGSNPLTCVPNQTSYSLGLPLCTDNDPINNPNSCQSVANIVGNVYTDLNGNCTYNNTDWKTQNIPVRLYDNQNNFIALSYTINGAYSFAALQPDTFMVKINDLVLPITMACGQANNQTVSLDSINQTISNINFPVVCDSAFDIEVHSVTNQGWVFPGQVHTLNTTLSNDVNRYNLNCDSTSSYSGTVTIQVVGPVTYVSPATNSLIPVVSGNTFTYSIADFSNLTPTSFGLQLLTDTTAQLGNQICVHVAIVTTPLDADSNNNEYYFCYNVTNSYDPNMKEVYPTDVLPGYNDWFTYTIHFQNTGTAPAFNIRLRDTLDTQLDLNTFEYLGASHTATTSLNGRNLSVRFNNIMLPDSTTDHDGSMGYYQYRVKPLPNIINGSNITNTAYIYFDYNPAIVTNTTESHFDITTSPRVIARRNDEAISIYPNPIKDKLYYSNLPKNSTIIIYNVLGEVCLTHHASLPFGEVGGASLPHGIYYCKVNGSAVVKLVKE